VVFVVSVSTDSFNPSDSSFTANQADRLYLGSSWPPYQTDRLNKHRCNRAVDL